MSNLESALLALIRKKVFIPSQSVPWLVTVDFIYLPENYF